MLVRVVRVLVVSLVAASSFASVPSLVAQGAPTTTTVAPTTTTVAPTTTTVTPTTTTTTVAPTSSNVEGWSQIGRSIDGAAGSTDSAGWGDVSLSDNGSRVAVSYPYSDTAGENAGEVRVFELVDEAWELLGAAILGSSERDGFGSDVSLSGDGSRVAVGYSGVDGRSPSQARGHVRVFELNAAGAAWVQVGGDLDGRGDNDDFGGSVSLSRNGSRLAVGAASHSPVIEEEEGEVFAGQVRVFDLDDAAGAAWVQVGQDLNGTTELQWAGSSVALSGDGSRVVVAGWGTDGVRVFDLDTAGTTWTQAGAGFAGSSFGPFRNVSLSGDGSHVAVGEPQPGNGKVEVFAQVGTPAVWTVVGAAISGTSAGDEFGRSVSLSRDGSRLAVGVPKPPPISLLRPGQATVYENDGTAWTAVSPAFDGIFAGHRFGWSVSLSADGRMMAVAEPGLELDFNPGQVRVLSANERPSFEEIQVTVAIEEGSRDVTTLSATDPDQDPLIYTISGGDDRGFFAVGAVTGELVFKSAPVFATPGSSNGDNLYEVEVTASDGQFSTTVFVLVFVTKAVPTPTPDPVALACAEGADYAHGFTDVSRPSKLSSNVGCIKKLGVTTGTSATTYSPYDRVTREQMAAFLARMYRKVTGKACSSTTHGFTDVPTTSYAYRDVGCIKDLGVTRGTSATTFSPYDRVTREQMAAFLARMYRKVTGKACSSTTHGFTDVPTTSYAYRDIGCIKDLGVTTGTSATTYSPYDQVTREQMAAFLTRLYRVIT